MFRRVYIGIVAVVLASTACLADSIKDLEKSYLSRYDEANGKRTSQLEKLQSSYLTAIKRDMAKVQSSGKLEAVIPYRDEIAFIEEGKDPLPALPETTSYQLKKMRGKYVEARQNILVTHATALVGLADKMIEVLEQRETEFTKAGKIDEALKAKKLRETYAADEEISAARNVLKFAGGRGTTPAALRLRRSPDNIEVIVRYDARGKVSMDSPVENVREQTGDGVEMGDTKAKVLGEFVGAEGYAADSWVAFHRVYDGSDPLKISPREIDAKLNFQEGEGKGVRLSLVPNAKNPVVSVGPFLTTKSNPGKVKITSRFLVPKANRVLSGLLFVKSDGKRFASPEAKPSGTWVTEELVGEPATDAPDLLMYLLAESGKDRTETRNDYVVLGELKVEQVSFSAYIQTKFGENGSVEERMDGPSKQPVAILNGDFVEN